MRAGPLSNPDVISVLSRWYVPLLVDLRVLAREGGGPGTATLRQLCNEAAAADGLGRPREEVARCMGAVPSEGGVSPFYALILDPDGRPALFFDQRDVLGMDAARLLVEASELGTRPGAALPSFQHPRGGPADELRLHVTARYLERTVLKDIDATRIGRRSFQFPVEAWVRLPRESWTAAFVPIADAPRGRSWKVRPDVARAVLVHFYPPTEASPPQATEVLEETMTATLLARDGDRATLGLRGRLLLRHPWWSVPDENTVDASYRGLVVVDTASERVVSFRLATERAIYYLADRKLNAVFGVSVTD